MTTCFGGGKKTKLFGMAFDGKLSAQRFQKSNVFLSDWVNMMALSESGDIRKCISWGIQALAKI